MTARGCRAMASHYVCRPPCHSIYLKYTHLLAFFSETGLNCAVFPAATFIRVLIETSHFLRNAGKSAQQSADTY